MWILKFRALNKKNKIIELLVKLNLKANYYPINHFLKKGRYYFIAIGTIEGNEKDIDKFFKEINKLRKAKTGRRLDFIERNENFFIIITSLKASEENKKFVRIFYNPEIIHLVPEKILEGGWEEWQVASPNRKALEKIIEVGTKLYNLKVKSFYWKKIRNIGFLTILPELTEKQLNALQLALENGYYDYPRKTSLKQLAKKAGLAFSTFQAHIRKAENKIISFAVKALRR